jgi:hypothetical protein
MTQLDSVRGIVGKILLDDWDPIGVRGVAQAQDEYDQYVMPVARMIVAGETASALSNYLLGLERAAMGLKGNPERARAVAEKLVGARIKVSGRQLV